MQNLPVNLVTWLLALSPIVVVLVLMVGLRWGGAKAGPAGWFTALLVATAFFGAGPQMIAFSQVKAVLFSVYVLYIIWMALLLYNVVSQAGAISVIGASFSRLTSDPVMQLLILGWVFASFLQGASGFGVPVAVVAPLLIGLGFAPVTAVVATMIGHAWSVSFGSMGSSFQALMVATGLPGEAIAPWGAAFMGVLCFVCGFACVHAYGRGKAMVRGALPIMVIGAVMGTVQYLMAMVRLWNVAAFVAGLVGLGVAALFSQIPAYRGAAPGTIRPPSAAPGVGAQATGVGSCDPVLPNPRLSPGWAVFPYALLIVLVILKEMWVPLGDFLDQLMVRVRFPAMTTTLGWTVPAEMGRSISVFGHAGALLAYTAIISYLLFRAKGVYPPGAGRKIVGDTVRGSISSSIGILTMVGFALMMTHSGMTYTLARGISETMGSLFPFFSVFVGALGAFMTGSNTNSNVVFGAFQVSTAELVGANVAIILAAQTAGGALGGMFAPAKIIVGCSTARLSGQEGEVLRLTLLYGLVLLVGMGLLTWVLT